MPMIDVNASGHYVGDCRALLADLPEGCVQSCITSPPYWGLRDYGRAGQIGQESTPEEYVAELVGVFREVRRVLRADGTLWLNLDDSYANKSLAGIPWSVASALRSDGWWLRQDIIWAKTSTMPERVKDRCTRAHEYLFLLSKSADYYFDNEAIREPATMTPQRRLTPGRLSKQGNADRGEDARRLRDAPEQDGKTRNKRSVWTIASQPYDGAHFATFPPKLIEPCILAGSRPGDLVLDPFFGSGTTGMVAEKHGRRWVGFDINDEYALLAKERTAQRSLVLEDP